MKYFEDFAVGDVYELGSRTVTAEDIVAFARKYDPQPFHLDEQAARESFFGGLAASGWHTSAIGMAILSRVIVRENWASLGAPGMDTCRWPLPVRPGDTLSGRFTVLDARRSSSRPMGLLKCRTELFNQDDAAVLLLDGTGMYALRPAAEDAA
jgi:acyl dehydratase